MKKTIDFLAELRLNNNRPWFEANKSRYKEVQEENLTLATELIAAIGAFDPSVRGLTAKDTTYRIYRDVRFSPDKSPYKTHVGVYICPHGKKSGYAGYYFHIEPKGDGLLGGNFIMSGLYMPDPVVLRSVRDDILDNGEIFVETMKKAKGFRLGTDNQLKRTPQGYPVGSPYDEYLRLKDIYLEQAISNDFLLQDNLAERVAKEFKKTYEFCALLNRSVDYANEEMR